MIFEWTRQEEDGWWQQRLGLGDEREQSVNLFFNHLYYLLTIYVCVLFKKLNDIFLQVNPTSWFG